MSFANMKAAYKRAKHFGVQFDGAFSICRNNRSKLAAQISNGCFMLGDPSEDLYIFDFMAKAINKFCDENKVSDDEDAKWAMACFSSVIWLNPEPMCT